jgi:hypothetical protein
MPHSSLAQLPQVCGVVILYGVPFKCGCWGEFAAAVTGPLLVAAAGGLSLASRG